MSWQSKNDFQDITQEINILCSYIRTSQGIIVKLTGESVNKVKMVVKSLVLKEPLSDNVQIVDSEVKEVLVLLVNLGSSDI